MAMNYAGRGKAYTEKNLIAAVRIHDSAYEYGDYAYDVESSLRRIRKRADRERFEQLCTQYGVNVYAPVTAEMIETCDEICTLILR